MRIGIARMVRFVLALGMALVGRAAFGQGPTIDLPAGPSMLERPSLPPSPGAGASPFAVEPGNDATILGGRPGPSFPRVPTSALRPGGGVQPSRPFDLVPPAELTPDDAPAFGALGLPDGTDDGPETGWTLDQAIERLVAANLELRALAIEIPQAQADILTAGLRANPIFYADTQLVPYGGYSDARPGGPTQYDINVTLPLDLNHKRRARVEVACRARKVLEAQFQDAVRTQIDNLYTAYVDVLAARESLRLATAGVEGLEQVAEVTRTLKERGDRTALDVRRIEIQSGSARVARAEAEADVIRASRTLAGLLALPPGDAASLQVRGAIRMSAPSPPTGPDLVALALAARPDLAAYRLGIGRAESDVKLARANAYSDVYLLLQPYTFQDNSPYNAKSSHSWAVGLTVPLPVFNRNQGNIQRARLNVNQARTELASLERQVVTEVEQAEQEFRTASAAAGRIEGELLPDAQKLLADSELLYTKGETDLIAFLNARREYNDVIRLYRDALIRHRRSMLRLNTAVGRRILP